MCVCPYKHVFISVFAYWPVSNIQRVNKGLDEKKKKRQRERAAPATMETLRGAKTLLVVFFPSTLIHLFYVSHGNGEGYITRALKEQLSGASVATETNIFTPAFISLPLLCFF